MWIIQAICFSCICHLAGRLLPFLLTWKILKIPQSHFCQTTSITSIKPPYKLIQYTFWSNLVTWHFLDSLVHFSCTVLACWSFRDECPLVSLVFFYLSLQRARELLQRRDISHLTSSSADPERELFFTRWVADKYYSSTFPADKARDSRSIKELKFYLV